MNATESQALTIVKAENRRPRQYWKIWKLPIGVQSSSPWDSAH